jgi:putative tryptophan/tyrosine transport system substrate-binding protein
MNRRSFIAALGGAAAAWPLAARAQQVKSLPTIGFLGASTSLSWTLWTSAFVRRLGELGWIDGRSVAIEYRWAEGRRERFAEIAAEFVQLKVDVGGGLVVSLGRPGGNTTGLSMQASDAAGKRLELLREVVPGLRRLAVIGDVEYPATVQEIAEIRAAARTLGLDLDVLEIRRAEDIAGTYPALKAGSQALYVCASPLVNANHARINTLALGARLPTMHAVRDFLGAAGFMSYGPSLVHSFRRAADYVDKILRGAKPGDLPVEQPTKFDLVFNLTTAKALDLEIPPTLLARADEVIE